MLHKALIAAALLAFLSVTGCSSKFYTEQADREVYKIVAEKNVLARGSAPKFTIEGGPANPSGGPAEPKKEQQETPANPSGRAGEPAPVAGAPATALPEPSPEAMHVKVADALRLAVRVSRTYQTQRETVYLAALTLTFERYIFSPHPTATGKADLNNLDGGSADQRTRSWDGTAGVGVSQQLADGMIIVGNLGLTALKFINRQLGDTVDSTLDFSITQPLWRGAGRQVVQENLVQTERNALYAVRSFARFEQDFAVNVASQYLKVLQQRDVVLNEWGNYRALVSNREQAEWLAKAERQPQFQVDQARQDELRARDQWIRARQAYENGLDAFKIVLGVPVGTAVALDPKELERLASEGLKPVEVEAPEAIATALQTRLDLANARDGVEDAGRKIVVAEDGLKGDVDLVASLGYASDPLRSPQSARLAFHKGEYSIGFDIDMPVDRLQERNALRQTEIARERAERTHGRLRDTVVLDVRQACRKLDQSRQSYEIQKRSVALAERRVESTELLLQAGRASQRDVLEAQRALVEAQNALARALVDHTVAGLEFQRDVGTLVVDQEGQIHGWSLTPVGP